MHVPVNCHVNCPPLFVALQIHVTYIIIIKITNKKRSVYMTMLLTKKESTLLEEILSRKSRRTFSILQQSTLIAAGASLTILPLLFLASNISDADRILHVSGLYFAVMFLMGIILLISSFVLADYARTNKEKEVLQTILRKVVAGK